ncbi:hypothetical protein ABH999_003040 [Bradyrhizobium yuanmingense]
MTELWDAKRILGSGRLLPVSVPYCAAHRPRSMCEGKAAIYGDAMSAPGQSPERSAKALLLEGVNDSAVDLFASAGFTNVERLTKALDGADLRHALEGVSLLGIRSRTQITDEVLAAAGQLLAVGCFSVGTNQVDLSAARKRGIPVFNAPFSNTRSVAELVIGEIVMLLRRIFPRSVSAHAGGWDKSAAGSREVRGRTLGIVGYGNIGSQLSTLAEAMGMRVIYFDRTDKLRHGNTEPVEKLEDLLAQSDVVSLHVPETAGDCGHDRREGAAGDEAGLVSDQQQPRHRGRSRCAGACLARRSSRRCGRRRLSRRAFVECRSFQ